MTERTLVPTLALIVSITLSAVLTAFATDNRYPSATMGAAGDVVDAAVNDKVVSALQTDPGLVGSKLAVVTHSGIVTLTGTVPNESILQRTLELASNIRGVREVRSSLIVEPIQ